MLPEGWYHVAGDPADTRRYWDGAAFVGAAVRNGRAKRKAGYVRPNESARWRLAGITTRLISALVDHVAPAIIVIGLARSFGVENPGGDLEMWRASTDLVVAIAAAMLLNQVVLVAFTGLSLGRVVMGTKVVDAADRDRSPGLVRALLRFLIMWPGVVVSIPMVLLGKRRLFHDLAANTTVIYQ